MQNILYVAEKANAGADIAKVLGLTRKTKDGFFTGDFADKRIIVAWASGHYITLKEPKDIDEKFAKWNIEDLPITFDLRSGLKVVPGKEKAFNTLADYLHGADLIINCGDAGREGELIQRWIYKMAGVGSKPVKRLWTSSLTHKGIKEANNNLHDSSEYDDLYAAGETRAVMDAFLGFNYSRALSLLKTDGVTIAYGRCQTPLLRAIVDRDKEIENFASEPFAYIKAAANLDGRKFTALLSDQKDRSRIEFKDKSDAERIMTKLTGQLAVSDIRSERKKSNPPKPYSTLQLQKEMDKKYKISSAKTDKILQSLYDEHKMITYPRTDSEYLPAAMKGTVRNNLDCLMFGDYEKCIQVAALQEIPARYFKEETGEHHALLPEDDGDIETKYRKLSDEEKLVFDAIARRFISLFYPPNIYEITVVDLMDQEHLFIAKGKKEIDEGFKALYKGKHDKDDEDTDEEETANLPVISAGDRLTAEYELKEDATKPKKRYTESSLLTLMDINGIGTAATRSGLISELTKPKGSNKQLYAEKKKNCFYSTELGRSIINVVPEYMSNLDFLAAMDKKIKSVAEGEASRDDVLRMLETELEENLKLMKLGAGKKTLISKKPAQKESGYKCPLCGRVLYEYDKGYGCSGYSDKSCSFFLHRKKGGRRIPQTQISKLLKSGKTDTIKGFKSRTGKNFDTQLVLTEEGKVVYAFQDK